jgi:DNA-binding response OmpR family regulator
MATAGVILLAEDDRKLRKLYTDTLKAAGYNVIAASDGAEALELLHTLKPKLILLDVMMPKLNGIETCKRIRKKLGSEVPVVFLTALDQLDTVHECIAAGGDDYVVKSESLVTILGRVEHWMRFSSGRKQLSARRDEMLAEVSAEVNRVTGAAVLSSEADESVRDISEFVAQVRTNVRDDFGKTTKEKRYLLGYVTGVVEHWAQMHSAVENRFLDYLKAVLGETGLLEDDEVSLLVSALDELSADTSFGIARAHGRNDPAQRLSRGLDFDPIGLSQFGLAGDA